MRIRLFSLAFTFFMVACDDDSAPADQVEQTTDSAGGSASDVADARTAVGGPDATVVSMAGTTSDVVAGRPMDALENGGTPAEASVAGVRAGEQGSAGTAPHLLALRVSIVAGQGLKTKRLAPNRRWLRARYRRVENLKADKSAQLVSRLPWVATPSVVDLPRVQ